MKEKLKEILQVLNSSIFVGERKERNLRHMAVSSVIIVALGFILITMNLVQEQYMMAVASGLILLCGLLVFVFVTHYRARGPAVVTATVTLLLVLTFVILFADNGFGYLWTLLVPLIVCYIFSVRTGILITVWFQLLFIILFYTPLRSLVQDHYSEIVLSRFPILFFFHGLLIIYVMYQYHKSVLFEIEHTNRLNEEVERQTAVAEERSRRIEQMSFQTIQTLAHAIDAKDPYTKGHSTRVSQYAVAVAGALGWDRVRISELRYAALLHDIGKIGVPDSILNNPGRLTDVEYGIIKSHTTLGAEILHGRIMISTAEDVARSHHERYDGSGYPQGLRGSEISEEARIVAIADAFDAMSSARVYRKACDRGYIRQEMEKGRGTQFDPEYTDAFLALWDSGEIDWIARSGEAEGTEDLEASSALLQEVVEAFISQTAADNTDVTTGVMNRSAGEAAIARAMKESGGCFVFLDIDNLKIVNDTFGHEAGDRVLRIMGERLREESPDGLCCRSGGDEFLLFLREAGRAGAEERVRRLTFAFEAEKNRSAETAAASVSAGITMTAAGEAWQAVYNRADKALYHVKQNGKNGYGFYRDETEAQREERPDLGRLVDGIRSSGSYEGAMSVDYRQFAKLYEFVANLEKRFSHPFALLVITLRSADGSEGQVEETEKAMYYMEQAIRQAVRNVDVLTRCGGRQFLIILVGTGAEGAETAADRIFRGYYKMAGSGAFLPEWSCAFPEDDGEGSSH